MENHFLSENNIRLLAAAFTRAAGEEGCEEGMREAKTDAKDEEERQVQDEKQDKL